MERELLKRWQVVCEKPINVEEIDTAVMMALQYLNPQQFIIKREKGGQTIVYDVIFKEAGEKNKLLGRYTITPFKHFLNWFDDNTKLESVVFGMIIHEIEKMLPSAKSLIQKLPESIPKSMGGPKVSALGKKVSDKFNEDELRDLARKLSIDYEDLSGDNKLRKAHELVENIDRHGRVSELLEILREERPRDTWSIEAGD